MHYKQTRFQSAAEDQYRSISQCQQPNRSATMHLRIPRQCSGHRESVIDGCCSSVGESPMSFGRSLDCWHRERSNGPLLMVLRAFVRRGPLATDAHWNLLALIRRRTSCHTGTEAVGQRCRVNLCEGKVFLLLVLDRGLVVVAGIIVEVGHFARTILERGRKGARDLKKGRR
jgi:hypothetical protein